MPFKFEVRTGTPMPVAYAIAVSHDFPWDAMAPGTDFEVPIAYWEARGVEKDKYKGAAARQRIKTNFHAWQAKDKKRAKFRIDLRTKKDGTVGVWFSQVPAK